MVKIEFKYPDEVNDEFLMFDGGCYDTAERTIYIFDQGSIQHLIDTITHETLHAVIHRITVQEYDYEATVMYDSICTSVEQWNRKV